MKRIINYIFLLSFASIIGFSSCSQDWLSPSPENQIEANNDSIYSDPAGAEKFANAAYNQLLEWSQHSFSWIGMSSITSDNADKGSTSGSTGSDKDQMDAFTYTANSSSLNEVWSANYQGVNRCNQALANIPKYTISQDLANRLNGEVKFLRAYYYFNLVRCWGDVPKVTEPFTNESPQAEFENLSVRVPKEEIYALIELDLEDAIRLLPEKSGYNAENIGRANKGAAMGLLAKVSMYLKKWDKALDLTNQIMASGEYALATDYTKIWREEGENSSESLFEVQTKGTSPFAAIQQYGEVQWPRVNTGGLSDGTTAGATGWGFNTPSEDLANVYEPGDQRKDATIIFRGQTLWDGMVASTGLENERYNYKAYVSKTKETWGNNSGRTKKNLRILRYGEILLINAEAANETGDISKATQSLNAIRNRAGLGVTTATTKEAIRLAIWKERRVELAMEHDRFFDLVRQGRAGEVLRAHGKAFVDGKNEVFPIPQNQINASGNKLTQNPGY